MKKSRFTEEQITFALRQAESGMAVSDVCRQIGVSESDGSVDPYRVLQPLSAIVCHGGLISGLVVGCLAPTIEPDRGHRL